MNYLVLQHFSRPPRAAIANAILIPAKVQSHKLEHKGKLEISLPHHGEMVLCCARIYRSDSIRETVSDKLVHLSSLSPKRSCHSDHPPGTPQAVLISALALAPHPNLQAVWHRCLPSWGQRSRSWRGVSLGLEWYRSSEWVFWVMGHALMVLGTDPKW